MNVPNHPPLHPHKIRTTRPVRPRLVQKREIVENIHRPDLLIDNVPPILRPETSSAPTPRSDPNRKNVKTKETLQNVPTRPNKLVRKNRHLAIRRITPALQPRTRRPIRHLDLPIRPTIQIRISRGLDRLPTIPLALPDDPPTLLPRITQRPRGIEQPIPRVGDDVLDACDGGPVRGKKHARHQDVGVGRGGGDELGEGGALGGVVEGGGEVYGERGGEDAGGEGEGRVVFKVGCVWGEGEGGEGAGGLGFEEGGRGELEGGAGAGGGGGGGESEEKCWEEGLGEHGGGMGEGRSVTGVVCVREVREVREGAS